MDSEKYAGAIAEAETRWQAVAERAGWGEEFPSADLTVWVNRDGSLEDAVATRTGGRTVYVKNFGSDRLLVSMPRGGGRTG